MRVLKDCKVTENPLDSHYKALNCELRLMDKTDPMFKVLLLTKCIMFMWTVVFFIITVSISSAILQYYCQVTF